MPYLPNFRAIAEKIVSMGGHVHPVMTGEKALTVPNWQNAATRDPAVVATWAAEDPHYNCAVVGKPDGLWLFDDDEDVLGEYALFYGTLQTYRVRSVSGGTHLYFRQNDASRQMGNIGGKNEFGQETWSARVNNRYVISAGSVAHPNNDPTQPLVVYKAIDPNASVIEAPESFIEFLKEKHASTANRKTIHIESGKVLEGGRNNYLTMKAGRLRFDGAETEEIESALQRMNDSVCSPPLESDEVHTIAASIGSKPYRDDTCLIGDNPAGFAVEKADSPNWRQHLRSVTELDEGEIRMLIEAFLPEGTTFIGGLPGEGKTLLALSIAKALTTGKNFLGRPDFTVPEIMPVLYLIPEVGGRAFRKRCEKFHIPDDPNLFLCRTISEGTTLQLDDPIVLEAVRAMKPVVFLDTVVRFNQSTDENAAAQNKMLVDSIIGLRQAGARSVIGLHHSTKAMRKEGISLESVLRGTGDLAACCDAVYGLLRDDFVYAKNTGPNEIEVECAKARDYDAPIPFRIAASRRVDSNVIGIARGIVSNIDEYGDFRVVSDEGSQDVIAEMLIRLVKEDGAITIGELAKATKLTPWVVRKTLTFRGWVKDRGGSKGASRWRFDLNAAGKKAKQGQPVSLSGIKVEMDDGETEDISLD